MDANLKKSRIAVVGVGEMGRAALGILARRLPHARFVVLDRAAANVAAAVALDSARIEGRVDSVTAEHRPDLRSCDVVVNTAGPFYLGSDATARAALDAKVPYIDICDDIEGTHAILALDDEARAAGIPLLTGAGSSPGISNLMAMRVLGMRPHCDGIRIIWIVRDADPGGVAPLRHMLHMAINPAPVLRDGAMVDAPGYVPETALEHEIPGVGTVRAFNTAHPEPLTLSRACPSLKQITVQGALLPSWANDAMSVLGRLGFGDNDLRIPLDGGGELEPAEALWRLLWARHHKRHRGGRSAGLCAMQVQGLVGEAPVTLMSYVDDESMMRTTGIGAAAATLSILELVPPPGAHGVEALDADWALDIVEELFDEEGAVKDGIVAEDLVVQK